MQQLNFSQKLPEYSQCRNKRTQRIRKTSLHALDRIYLGFTYHKTFTRQRNKR